MSEAPSEPELAFADAQAWEAWLEVNHLRASGVWVAIVKKEVPLASVRYPEVLESAICFGWIDARRQRRDATSFRQRFTPRRPSSRWSKINREKAEALIAAGRMRPAGLAEVERARSDGRWEAAYAGQRTAEVPADLRRALEESPTAAAQFEKLSSQNRYSILYRLGEAKRAQTRAARLEKFVAMLEAGETIHPQ